MDKHAECKRGFTHLSRAWYGDACLKNFAPVVDEITIGFYHHDGGTTGEFHVSWEELAGKIVPRLKAYDDSWNALFHFGDVLESMSDVDDKNITPDEFASLLLSLGIEDMTKEDV